MKTMKLINLFIASLLSLGVLAQSEKEGFEFKDITNIKVTSVKDQQSTGTCWSFSTTSFIEAELLRMNNAEFDLSEISIDIKDQHQILTYKTFQKNLNTYNYIPQSSNHPKTILKGFKDAMSIYKLHW